MDPRDSVQGHYPVVRTETARFGRRIDLSGGLEIYGAVSFEATIQWLRISETRVLVLAEDGTVLHRRDGSTDFHGLLHSTVDMPARVDEICKLYAIGPHTPLRAEARLIVTDHPVVYSHDDQGTPTYRRIPQDWRYADDPGFLSAGTASAASAKSNWIAPKVILDRPIWSSRDLTLPAQKETYDSAMVAALGDLEHDQRRTILASLREANARVAAPEA